VGCGGVISGSWPAAAPRAPSMPPNWTHLLRRYGEEIDKRRHEEVGLP
jgi:hypothetical protein